MVNPSKANALNKRAENAVSELARWGNRLKDELKKQSPLQISKWSDDLYPETIELNRKDIELLVESLGHIRRELERFIRPS